MRRIDPSKKEIIAEYIDKHFCENDEIPSVRDIVEGTGIPLSTVHRYLISMREDGALDYSGRRTARTKMMEDTAPIHALQVLGTVACGPGQEEEQPYGQRSAEELHDALNGKSFPHIEHLPISQLDTCRGRGVVREQHRPAFCITPQSL